MKLKIQKAKINQGTGTVDGVENIPAFYDPDTGEEIASEEIEIERILWNRNEGRCYVEFSLGGTKASDGKYKKNPNFKNVPYLFLRDKHTQQIWQEYDLENGPPTIDIAKQMLIDEIPAFRTCAKMAWVSDKTQWRNYDFQPDLTGGWKEPLKIRKPVVNPPEPPV